MPGSLIDAPTVFYIVVFIAVLNLIAFTSVNDWKSVVFMLLAAGACYAVTPDQTLALVVGIVASNLFRASSAMQEGMAEKPKDKKKIPEDMRGKEEPFENLATMDIKGLMAKQMQLMAGIKGMAPLLAQAQETMAKLPKGFLQDAMKKMKLPK